MLTIPNSQLEHSGAYWVVVSNAYGRATSQVFSLTVTSFPPKLLTWFPARNYTPGETVRATASVSSEFPIDEHSLFGTPFAMGDSLVVPPFLNP